MFQYRPSLFQYRPPLPPTVSSRRGSSLHPEVDHHDGYLARAWTVSQPTLGSRSGSSLHPEVYHLDGYLSCTRSDLTRVRKMLFFIPFLVDDSHLTLDLYIYLSHFHLFSRLPLTRLRQPHNACFILFFFPSILLLLSYLSCIPLLKFPSKHQKQIQ